MFQQLKIMLASLFWSDGAKHVYWLVGWFAAVTAVDYGLKVVSSGAYNLTPTEIGVLTMLLSGLSKQLHNNAVDAQQASVVELPIQPVVTP